MGERRVRDRGKQNAFEIGRSVDRSRAASSSRTLDIFCLMSPRNPVAAAVAASFASSKLPKDMVRARARGRCDASCADAVRC